jgi:ActD protein
MAEINLLAVFDGIDPAADGIEKLHEMGLSDDQITVISGVPVAEPLLGRPLQRTFVPRIAMGGAITGFLFGLFLNWGTPSLYGLHVGGQPVIAIPPGIIIVFEMTMLGLMLSTFIGMFLNSNFPTYRPHYYVPEVSDGKIAVMFPSEPEQEGRLSEALTGVGAESVQRAEARQL